MNSRLPFLVKKLSKDALLPKKGSKLAAGYDVHAFEDVLVPAQGKAVIKTGIAIKIPPNTYARIAPRSGLAAKNHIQVGAGVIDQDYRGEVCVLLFNHSKTDFQVKKYDRVAQMIIEKIEPTELYEVEDLDETERGASGFGSTGISTEQRKVN